MLKPDLVRAALVEAMPEYGRDPDRLAIFIDKGRLAARFSATNFNYEYRYTLNILLLDYAGHPDLPMLAMVRWIAVHQPELLLNHQSGNEAVQFEADVLAAGKIDLSMKVDLNEAVRVIARGDGGYDLEHLPEPSLGEEFAGVPLDTTLREIWSDGQQLVPPAYG